MLIVLENDSVSPRARELQSYRSLSVKHPRSRVGASQMPVSCGVTEVDDYRSGRLERAYRRFGRGIEACAEIRADWHRRHQLPLCAFGPLFSSHRAFAISMGQQREALRSNA